MIRALFVVLLACTITAQQRRPNIIFFFSDDHAAHAISSYGSRINQTPNIDRLATGGMRFANCFATNAICGPARATVLTGKYSHRNGFARNEQTFDGDQTTFPKLLQAAGYATALIGKWHLSSDPQGFDDWCVLPGQGIYENPWFIDNGERKRVTGYVTDIITERSLDWLSHRRPKDQPFLLMCQHKAPHRNWQPAPRHASLYEDVEIPTPVTFDDDWSNRSSAASSTTMTIERHLTKTDVKMDPPEGLDAAALKRWKYQRYIKDYLRCVAAVDEGVGKVLDWLDTSGLADDTIVIYTSDQGFFLGDHGWYDKRFMYEESLRSPLLVRWPGKIAPGKVSDAFALNVDFAPTFLELAGVKIPDDVQGDSLVPLFRGATPKDWRRSMYYRYYEYPDPHDVHPHFGVRTDRYKLIRFPDLDAWELFDLSSDPHELRSVAADPDYANVRTELQREMLRLQAELGDDGDVHDPRLARFADVEPMTLGQWRTPPKAALPRDVKHDVSSSPFSFGATVTPMTGTGVIGAMGGSSRGFVLWLADGIPCFALRNGSDLRTVRATAPIPMQRASQVVGALANDGRLKLFVDGEELGSAPGSPLDGLPTEGLSIGFDDETPVVADPAHFDGAIVNARLWRGTMPRW